MLGKVSIPYDVMHLAHFEMCGRRSNIHATMCKDCRYRVALYLSHLLSMKKSNIKQRGLFSPRIHLASLNVAYFHRDDGFGDNTIRGEEEIALLLPALYAPDNTVCNRFTYKKASGFYSIKNLLYESLCNPLYRNTVSR